MDRTAQNKAVTDLIQPTFDLRVKSDAAAKDAADNRAKLVPAQTAYQLAMNAFIAGTGLGADVDRTRATLLALQKADPVLMQASTEAFIAWSMSWHQLQQAVSDLGQDPGAVESV